MFRQTKNNEINQKSATLNMESENNTQEIDRRQLQKQINVKNLQKFKTLWPLQRKALENFGIESEVTGESYAETSNTSLQTHPGIKHYTCKAIRQMMEVRRIKFQNLPTHSSDSSFDGDRAESTRVRCLRRKSKLERDIFWRKFNDFLTRSLDYMESNRSSCSSDS